MRAGPALIGKNLIDIKAQEGNYLIRAHIEIAKGPGSGWVSYKWPNPLTNRIEDKISMLKRWETITSWASEFTPNNDAREKGGFKWTV
ncbi:MAG: cache domain-containing protein [Xanthobacteraceae bacterium]